MVEAKLLRKKLKNGLIVDKWDLVTIIEKQEAEIEELKEALSVKVILNEHAQQSMKEVKGLLRKAQDGH
jgi:putative ribosome biogenesis GTPase RsgA